MAISVDSDSGNSVLSAFIERTSNPSKARPDSNHRSRRCNTFSRRSITIASYHTRSLDENKLFQLANGCERYGIDIVAVQEHRRKFDDEEIKYRYRHLLWTENQAATKIVH